MRYRARSVIGGIALGAIGLSVTTPTTTAQSRYELQTLAVDPTFSPSLDDDRFDQGIPEQHTQGQDTVGNNSDSGNLDAGNADASGEKPSGPPRVLALEKPNAPSNEQPAVSTETTTPVAADGSTVTSSSTGPTTVRPPTTQAPTNQAPTNQPTTRPPATTRPTTTRPASTLPPTTRPSTTRPPTTQATTQPPLSYQLVWADEFNSFDQTKWRPEHSTYGDGNNELQCYTPNNVTVVSGVLHLTAKDETVTCPNGSTRDYSSGMVRTRNLASWKYGRFEARINLPEGQGFWPGLWMSPVTRTYGSWPRSGELDIVEAIGSKPNRIIGSVHWQGPSGHRLSNKEKWLHDGTTFTGGFHTYVVEWEPGKITWFVDGEQYHQVTSWDAPAGAAFPAPFDQEFYLKMQLSVGGRSPGDPDHTTPFPSSMQVDWIRVYQLR